MVSVVQTNELAIDDYDVRKEREKNLQALSSEPAKDAKAAKGATPAEDEKTPEFEPAPHHFEN